MCYGNKSLSGYGNGFKTFDYEVKINGVAASLDTARVSSVPFNRRWPGHQRGIEQTELVNFLSLEADEDVYFEITPQRPFEQVHIGRSLWE